MNAPTDSRQVRAARAILGLSQEELARTAGVHRNTVYRAETKAPCQGFAEAIGAALEPLGISFDAQDGSAFVMFRTDRPTQASG